MPGQELRLGPFIGGLNLFSDPTAVADTEMVSCLNFEVGIDGSLLARPPITVSQTTYPNPNGSIKVLMLAFLNGTNYLIGSSTAGIYYSTGGAWTLINNGVQADTAIQYQNKVWFYPKIGTTNGGTWDGTTFTSLTTLPAGSSAIVFKERTWIVPGPDATTNAARLQYSLVGDPGSWNTGDATFIDIGPGDGKKLIDLITYQDNIMLFKEDSTYALAFDAIPSSATLKKVNNIIGATGKNCVVSWENTLYTFHRSHVYEIINYQWVKINVKVPFVFDNSSPSGYTYKLPFFLTIWGDRLICRYYKKVYSFGLRTRTWTEFQISTTNREQWFGPLTKWPVKTGNPYNLDTYYGGSCFNEDLQTFQMNDGYDATTQESTIITCSMQTKNFDSAYGRRYRIFSFGQRFKHMHWWGADVVTNQTITGIATPIVTNFTVTWGQIKSTPWQNLNTWQQPIVFAPAVSTVWTSPGIMARHFAKFQKGMRYRQINFQIILTTDGTLSTGPCRLFGIINAMEVKQVVTKGVN